MPVCSRNRPCSGQAGLNTPASCGAITFNPHVRAVGTWARKEDEGARPHRSQMRKLQGRREKERFKQGCLKAIAGFV